jgi:hypothetical protein
MPSDADLTVRVAKTIWPHEPLPEIPERPRPESLPEPTSPAENALWDQLKDVYGRLEVLERTPPPLPTGKGAAAKAFKAHADRLEAALRDLPQRIRPAVEEAVEGLVVSLETRLDELAGRVGALEGRPALPPKPTGPLSVTARPVHPGTTPPAAGGPTTVGPGAGTKGPAVTEGSRPLEHGLRGDQERPKAPARLS